MEFEWDSRKDAANRRKHGVGFREAATAFGDPLAITFPDHDHSITEGRFLTLAASANGRLLVVAHTERDEVIRISVRDHSRAGSEDSMKKSGERRNHNDLRREYDFAAMKGGVRGKYYERYRKGTNVVVLKPEVAEAFPTDEAVNEALSGILRKTRAVRQTGGLSDRALADKRSTRH